MAGNDSIQPGGAQGKDDARPAVPFNVLAREPVASADMAVEATPENPAVSETETAVAALAAPEIAGAGDTAVEQEAAAAPVKAAPAAVKRKSAATKVAASKAAPEKTARTAKLAPAPGPVIPIPSSIKETHMSNTPKFAEGIQKVVTESQGKVKLALAKSTALAGEYGDLAKGNVEAFVESGKILAAGLQDMGSDLVAETKTAFETVTADVKQLTGVKSPTEFVKVQSDIMRRNMDQAVALTSKNSEALLKLASDTFGPISGRFNLMVEKFRKAA